VINKMVCRCCR